MIPSRASGVGGEELGRFYTVTEPKRHQRGYTVYKVTARIVSRRNPDDVQEIIVWRRYSDFKKLHKDIWQIHRALNRSTDLFPPFAKAKVFGSQDLLRPICVGAGFIFFDLTSYLMLFQTRRLSRKPGLSPAYLGARHRC